MSDFTPNTEGVFFDLPEDVYRTAPGVNISALKEAITPAHYRAVRDAEQPEEPTPAQIFGRAFHAFALEGRVSFVIKPEGMDYRSKEGKAWRDAQTAPILTQDEADSVKAMRTALDNHDLAKAILRSGGRSEVSAFKRHSSGLLLKGRADYLTTDEAGFTTIVDLKSCGFGDASETQFNREIAKWGYHRQDAFYRDMFGATFFLFIAVEKVPPYGVNVLQVDAEAVAKGRAANERDLAMLAEADASGLWQGYTPGMKTIKLPKWAE